MKYQSFPCSIPQRHLWINRLLQMLANYLTIANAANIVAKVHLNIRFILWWMVFLLSLTSRPPPPYIKIGEAWLSLPHMWAQDYHLRVDKQQEKERGEILRDLVSGTDKKGSEQAPGWEPPFHRGLEFAERILRWHEVILSWIEQCRLAMDPPPPTPVEEGTGQQNPSSNRQRRSKRPNTPTVLGKVRVSKSTPKSQNSRTWKLNTIIPTPDYVASTNRVLFERCRSVGR